MELMLPEPLLLSIEVTCRICSNKLYRKCIQACHLFLPYLFRINFQGCSSQHMNILMALDTHGQIAIFAQLATASVDSAPVDSTNYRSKIFGGGGLVLWHSR